MQYDQSWMGYGIVGGLQAGLIAAAAGLLLFFAFHWLGRRNGWGYGPQIGWTFLLATALTASGDLWNLFYFNYGRLQSLQLLKVKRTCDVVAVVKRPVPRTCSQPIESSPYSRENAPEASK